MGLLDAEEQDFPQREGHPLWGLLAGVRLVHQLPGRVRLKLTGDNAIRGLHLPTKAALNEANAALLRAPGIRSVRINLFARSCVIEYDPQEIPDAAWSDFLDGKRSVEASALEHRIRETLHHEALQGAVREVLGGHPVSG